MRSVRRGAALALALVPALLLAGCATPETRLRGALVEAGLPKPVAGCMAGRMVDRLSVNQLSKLQSLGRLAERDPGDVTINEFVRRTRALRDLEILAVTTKAGLACAIND